MNDDEEAYLTVYRDKLYFQATNGTSGREPYYYDDFSPGPPQLLRDINPNSGQGSYPRFFFEFEGKLFFGAEIGASYGDLWFYEEGGTPDPPEMAQEIYSGGNAAVSYPCLFNGAMFFQATTAANGTELWMYSGGSAVLASDIYTDNNSSNPQELIVYQDKLYFSAFDGYDEELFSYDTAGVHTMYDINTSALYADSFPSDFCIFNDVLYFAAEAGDPADRELFRKDGENFPELVYDLNVGGSSNPADLVVFRDKLYFTADNGSSGRELMVYDGFSPPALVVDAYPGLNSFNPRFLTVYNDKLFFQGTNGDIGTELFVYYFQ